METTQKIVMFDAELQKECDHSIDIDGNGEVVLTSLESGRFIKLPADTTPESLAAFVVAHKQENEGQVSVESIEKWKNQLAAALQTNS